MLAPEEVRAVPLCSTWPSEAPECLAHNTPALHFNAGEFAVHEGEEGARLAVISGKVEVVKRFMAIAFVRRFLG